MSCYHPAPPLHTYGPQIRSRLSEIGSRGDLIKSCGLKASDRLYVGLQLYKVWVAEIDQSTTCKETARYLYSITHTLGADRLNEGR